MFYTVKQAHVVIIERFGKFARVQRQGICFRFPFIEKIKRLPEWGTVGVKEGHLIELTEHQTNTPPRHCHTKDNVTVMANASVYWKIIDPAKAVYEVDHLPNAVSDVSLNTLRSIIGTMNLDEILSNRERVNERVSSELHQTASKWGVQFTRVEIQELTTSDETAKAMQQEMEAERKKRAMVAEADGNFARQTREAKGEQESMILRAQGQVEAMMLIAKAESDYLEMLTQKVGKEMAAQLLLADKYLQGMDKITKNPGDKTFLPNNFSAILSIPTGSQK